MVRKTITILVLVTVLLKHLEEVLVALAKVLDILARAI